MNTPLDDVYSDGRHDQKAYNKLMALIEPEGGFVWTAVPQASWGYFRYNFNRLIKEIKIAFAVGIFVSFRIVYILPEQYNFGYVPYWFLLLTFFLGLCLWLEVERRHTYYGISAGKVWVKQGIKQLKEYPVEYLTHLKLEEQTVFYFNIIKNEYDKYALLQNTPQAATAYAFIKKYQVEVVRNTTKKLSHDRRGLG